VLAVVGKSDVYIINRSEERLLPYWTPANTGKYGDVEVNCLTENVRLRR